MISTILFVLSVFFHSNRHCYIDFGSMHFWFFCSICFWKNWIACIYSSFVKIMARSSFLLFATSKNSLFLNPITLASGMSYLSLISSAATENCRVDLIFWSILLGLNLQLLAILPADRSSADRFSWCWKSLIVSCVGKKHYKCFSACSTGALAQPQPHLFLQLFSLQIRNEFSHMDCQLTW